MIHSISFKNYKSFRDGHLPLKRINILVGPNSAGKSSILKLFGLLKQSYSEGRRDLFLRYDGSSVDLHNFAGISHENNGQEVTITVECDTYEENEYPEHTIYECQKEHGTITISDSKKQQRLIFTAPAEEFNPIVFLSTPPKRGLFSKLRSTHLEQRSIELVSNDSGVFHVLDKGYYVAVLQQINKEFHEGTEPEKKYKPKASLVKSFYKNLQKNKLSCDGLDVRWSSPYFDNPSESFSFENGEWIPNVPDEEELLEFQVAKCCARLFDSQQELFVRMNNAMKLAFQGIRVIKPLRSYPKRDFTIEELEDNYFVGVRLDRLERTELARITRTLSASLGRLGLNYDFKFDSQKGKPPFPNRYTIALKRHGNHQWQSLVDVGFGLSQILPILIALETNRADLGGIAKPFLVIEQPELHLHPSSQAALGELLVESLYQSPKQWQGADKPPLNDSQILIETHSEHLIRGLQVLIAEGKLLVEHVGIFYVDYNEQNGSNLREMKMDEKGFFVQPWPTGFFDQALIQSMKLLDGAH